jgi:hypothetical protein
MYYDLFSLEVAGGTDLSYGDADPRLMEIAGRGNQYIRQFLSMKLSWADLLARLDSLGIDVDQYQEDVRENHRDRGLLWLS